MGKGYGSVRTEIDRWLAAHSHVILAPRSSKPPMSCYYDAFLALCAVLLWCLASALLGRCSVNPAPLVGEAGVATGAKTTTLDTDGQTAQSPVPAVPGRIQLVIGNNG